MKRPYDSGRAWIELDLQNLQHNVNAVKTLLPNECELMAVVKGNAYGHGAVPIAFSLNTMGVNAFCVASVAEAVQLRESGIAGEILILGYTHPFDFPLLNQYELTQAVISYDYAQELNSSESNIRVHVAIDTGMHRVGVNVHETEQILNIFNMEHLFVTGIYTHLCADTFLSNLDESFTEYQVSEFSRLVNALRDQDYIVKAHILGTFGLLHCPSVGGDYARIGMALYGVFARRMDFVSCPVALKPVLSLKARVMSIRTVHKGEYVGYGFAYQAERERRIATLSIGYADGYPRNLSYGRGDVMICGQYAPITGRICMDQLMVDVTHIRNVHPGDVAVLIGTSDKSEITVYDLAEQANTISTEIVSRLGARLPRLCI